MNIPENKPILKKMFDGNRTADVPEEDDKKDEDKSSDELNELISKAFNSVEKEINDWEESSNYYSEISVFWTCTIINTYIK